MTYYSDTLATASNTNLSTLSSDTLATASSEAIASSDSLLFSPSSLAGDSPTLVADSMAGLLPQSTPDPTHKFHPAEWIVPGAAAVLGAVCVNSSWGKQWRRWVQNQASQKGLYKVWIDNYMQYSPMVAVYALDLCGVKAQHSFVDRTILLAMSAATMAIVVNVAKYTFKEMRPDSSTRNSFPSGHTATSFMGAEFLWQEYRSTHPWIGYTGYAMALGVGFLRIHNHRHWVNDVIAGTAVGMLSTKFAYWLYPKIFKEHPRKGKKPKRATAFGMPFCGNNSAGVNMAVVF